jgi:hypothetical protein
MRLVSFIANSPSRTPSLNEIALRNCKMAEISRHSVWVHASRISNAANIFILSRDVAGEFSS